MRKPSTKPPRAPVRGPLGCVVLLALLLVELAVGGFTIYLVHNLALTVFDALGWRLEKDAAQLAAVFAGFAVAAPVVWAIDAWCKRRTGRSPMDEMPFIP